MASPDMLESLVGTVVSDRYRLEAVLGEGGMGAVFRARHLDVDRPVAVKIIHPGHGRAVLRSRFLREARLAAKLRHPQVVQVYDFGRWGEDRDRYFLVMELVEGVGLERLLDSLSVEQSVALADKTLEALAHCHARGILHRDFKPENVLVTRAADGSLNAKLMDFGISASLEDLRGERLTQDGETLGTPAYMAPEICAGRAVDGPGIDLYAVGVLLYRALSGELPFEGGNLHVMVKKISEDAPPLKPRDGVELPEGLAEVVERLLARDPADRYAVAADVRADLARFAGVATLDVDTWVRAGGPRDVTTARTELSTDGTASLEVVARGPEEAEALQIWGRQAEIEALDRVSLEVEDGVGRAVLLVGEAGLGKSELAREFSARLAESGRFRALRAAYHVAASSASGLRGAVEQALGTLGRGPAGVEEAARDLLRRFGDDDPDEVRALVTFLRSPVLEPASTPDGAQQGRNFALVLRVLRRLAGERPVVLVLEDLLAGGPDAAAFVEYALFEAEMEPFPLLLLATLEDPDADAATAAVLARSDRFEGRSRHVMRLDALTPEALAEGLVELEGLAPDAARRVAVRAGGNPLFAMHLARAGIGTTDQRLSTTSSNGSDEHRLPRVLRGILDSSLSRRLERAEHPELAKELLAHLAVLGETANVELLESFVDGETRERLDDVLDGLLDLGVLHEVRFGMEDVVGFAQGLMRDALLDATNRRRLRRLHRQAAEIRSAWAEGRGGDAEAGRVGDHYQQAGASDAAIDWWLRALAWEVAAGEALRGVQWGLSALELMDEADPRRAPTARRLGKLLLEAGELARAREVLTPIVGSADVDEALEAGDVLGDVLENMADLPAWRELLDGMEARLSEAGPAGRSAYGRARVLFLNSRAHSRHAIELARRALDEAQGVEARAKAGQRLAVALIACGFGREAIEAATEALHVVGDRSDLRIRAHRVRGMVLMAGRPEEAVRDLNQALELARRSGRIGRIPVLLSSLGNALSFMGETEQASERLMEAQRAADALGLRQTAGFSAFSRLIVSLQSGAGRELGDVINRVVDSASEAGFPIFAMARQALLGWAAANDGDVDGCVAHLDTYGTLDALPGMPQVVQTFEHIGTALAEHAPAAHEAARAWSRRLLGLAAAGWESNGATAWAARCRARLESLE